MNTEERILGILQVNPTLSNREIGKLLGIHRSNVLYYMNKLNIHRDRKILQKLNNTCREKRLTITPNAEQLILGSVLGDGYLSPHRHPEDTHLTLNSDVRIGHSMKQKAYAEYKMLLFLAEGIRCRLSLRKPNTTKERFIDGVKVTDNGSCYLKTQRNVVFNFYRDLFYRPNKRLNKYLYKLNPLGLAIWFMDDGYKSVSGFTFCIDGFTFEEAKFLLKLVKHNFDLETTILKTRIGRPNLYVRAFSREHFIELVSPYICDSMRYKLEL